MGHGRHHGEPFASWTQHRYGPLDRWPPSKRRGSGQGHAPNATVAVVEAGNIVFFDHRKSVDLFVYNDPFVGTRTPHRWVSTPSHETWDYAYSVGKLRPDVAVGLFDPTAKGLREMTQWGYMKAPLYFGKLCYLPGWFHPTRVTGPPRANGTSASPGTSRL